MLRLKKLPGKKEESAGCSLNNAIYIKPHFGTKERDTAHYQTNEGQQISNSRMNCSIFFYLLKYACNI